MFNLIIERKKIMSLVRFSQSPLFDRFFDGELFDWSNKNFSQTNTTLPSVNIKENENEYMLEVAAPGFEKEDFKIEHNNDLLTISSEKKVEKETKEGERFTKREFSYQSFSRSFTLPQTADGEKISANYEKGILTVSIPKREEAKPKAPRLVQVN